jgi:hypothetical protein
VSRVAAQTALVSLLVSATLVFPAAGAPPKGGEFTPGRELGGVKLGMTKQEVLAVWGKRHGVCRSCPRETWYFNYRPFEPEGAGVVFERGRVVHVFTVWQPSGWRTPQGLELGDPSFEASRVYGSLDRRQCTLYHAFVLPGRRAQSIFYVFEDQIWGFGLTEREASPCL